MPLVYRHLSEQLAEAVPAPQLARLREHYRHNAARNLYLTSELCRILKLFEEQGIEAIPYKGPALAVSAYGELALRQFVDLDVLVRPRDVERASAVLEGEGYQPHFKLSAEQLPAFLRLSYVQSFTQDEKRRTIELHWAIAPRFFSFALTAEEIFAHVEKISLGHCQVLAPATEELLLMLVAHGTKDHWERLEWVSGIGELAVRPDVKWSKLWRRAEELGGRRMLVVGLGLARRLLETPLPTEVLREMERDGKAPALVEEVIARMFHEGEAEHSLVRTASFQLRTKERWRDRTRFLLRLAATPTPVDWAMVRLPPALSFFYFFLRPFRLAKKYVFDASRRML